MLIRNQFPQIPPLDLDVLLFYTVRTVTVTSSVFCSIKNVFVFKHDFIRLYKFFKKNTENGLLSCHICNAYVIRTGCSMHHNFRLKNNFAGAERCPGLYKSTVCCSDWSAGPVGCDMRTSCFRNVKPLTITASFTQLIQLSQGYALFENYLNERYYDVRIPGIKLQTTIKGFQRRCLLI